MPWAWPRTCSTSWARARLIARGPKARGAIEAAGLTADWVATSETAAEIQQFLLAEGVVGLRIAVQHHGSGADGLDEAFAEAGADRLQRRRLQLGRLGPRRARRPRCGAPPTA